MHFGSPAADVLSGILAFLVGGIPFGWLFARWTKGVDLRKIGSGNVGATNAARLFRSRRKAVLAFTAVFLLDCAKGFVAAWSIPVLARALGSTVIPETSSVILGAAAILGHVFTPYLSFRGGKGVATALGVVAALATMPAVYAVGVWGALVAITGYVSLGSVFAMVTIPVSYLLKYGSETFHARFGVFAFLLACAVVVIWRHRGNLARILAKTERKVGRRRAASRVT